ncbi:type IV conjugative transfer system protein TraL [Neisseria sp. CCUG12390]|uniref:type IV conjugative transfer system protein TraL n=1 Tax=Neisseria sp. CCUG12390 TaxID=3392035 RepID=UPI003A103331
MNHQSVVFPEYVDTLPQFLFMESDDISVFISGMIIGVILQYAMRNPVGMIIGIVLGIWMAYQYVKFKRNTLPGTLLHMMYSLTGLVPLNGRFANGLLKRVDN